MLTPLPKDSALGIVAWGLNGVVGVPNSCRGWAVLEKLRRNGDEEMGGKDTLFEGVSGIALPAKMPPGGRSTFLLRLEIKPVDMNAAGRGLAILYASGVAKEDDSSVIASE